MHPDQQSDPSMASDAAAPSLNRRNAFPLDFIWGAATSSYQIEGRTPDDGRGDCIWTAFSHTPGKTYNGDTGDVAIEHLTRYREDIGVMREIGLQAYRFSVSWARVIPDGVGKPNPAGLDFYNRLIDALLAAGITPFLTLYHWDLPLALQDGGGWANRDIISQFADYAGLVASRYADRVQHWITINEPWCVAHLGHWLGIHAPGIQHAPTAFRVAHHTLMAHAAAVPVIRGAVPSAKVGIAPNLYPVYAASESEADKAAAQRYDAYQNRWFLDPVYKGTYPQDYVDYLTSRGMLDGIDLAEISAAAVPTDFLGINFYSRSVREAVEHGDDVLNSVEVPPAGDITAMGWEVYPQGLTEMLTRVTTDYAPAAIYITENGAAYDDVVEQNGSQPVIDDVERTRFVSAHFAAAADAIARGVPLKGFFVWSLFDNFEWAEGYRKRFGVVHVDYATQTRTLKRSGQFYRDWLAGT